MWPVRAGAGPALPLTAGVIGRRLGVRRGPARAGGVVLWGYRGGPHEGRGVTFVQPVERGVKKASTGGGETFGWEAPARAETPYRTW